ncbi:uncharacterized protein LOC114331370 [Diabrotica virgifera virgifera]|uniref:Uncharacterized protein LOC114331370 n=1 Tax=Diabrotica virgifera virgifera TaxID=50390 RepID=A0A6P7FUW6_DIAVI|nr:uncharacterized protein LOC114331370 [Diabrotica virgifera virgifera]
MLEEVQSEVEKIIPFNVCFVEKYLLGRSNIKIEKPLGLAPIITGKFYTNTSKQDEESHESIKKYMEKLNVKSPKEKYARPCTENQKYGWYHNVKFTEHCKQNKRLNFHKNTNILITEHLMNYAKIRE